MTEKTDPLETARCALANLDNLGKAVHQLDQHPFFKIVEMQLTDIIEALEGDE